MPKKHLSGKITRKKNPDSSFNYEDEDFLSKVFDLAYEGFYNIEIADELNISRSAFDKAIERHSVLRQTLEDARARAKEAGGDIPSPAKFKRMWIQCKGKRSELLKKFHIGYQTFKQWLKDDPRLIDIMAETEIEFLEKVDSRARMLALGLTKSEREKLEKTGQFDGWKQFPDAYMLRFFLNTIGRRYGYGENPTEDLMQDGIETRATNGIDISSWILKEMDKKGGDEQ